jgi:hypothetical protein
MMAWESWRSRFPSPIWSKAFDAAGLQPIAAEGALKAGVALQQRDLHPAAG